MVLHPTRSTASPAAASWLRILAPVRAESKASLGLVEVRGRAGWASPGTDLMIVLDLSESTLEDVGADLDEDGPEGGTDPELLRWIEAQPDAPLSLARRLRKEQDFDDTLLAAELEATAALIERLDLRRFRVGIAVFSDRAQLVVPVGRPRAGLEKGLAEIRRSFHRFLRGTDFADAIRVAHAALLAAPTSTSRLPRQRVIVFLSDGAPTLPVHDGPVEAALEAAMAAGVDDVRIFPFSIGPGGERARKVLDEMARWTGGRHVHVERPAETALRLRELEISELAQLEIVNTTTGAPARAVRIFPDGSFDGLVPLGPGRNELRIRALRRDGARFEQKRAVTVDRAPRDEAERAEAARLMQELRTRTREMEAWAELARRRRTRRRVVEIEAVPPSTAVPRLDPPAGSGRPGRNRPAPGTLGRTHPARPPGGEAAQRRIP